jgi:hypothetical protein
MNPGFVRDIAKGSPSNEKQETIALDEPSDVLEIIPVDLSKEALIPRGH